MNPAHAQQLPNHEPMSDEAVVQRIVAGETALFEILMRRHNQRLYRAVRAILGRENDVEDVLQQAWINAYRYLHQFEDRARFSTWLTRIAINEAKARLKKEGRGLRDAREEGRGLRDAREEERMSLLPSSDRDPEQQAASSQLREVLEREVAALPEIYRTPFVLREVEGLSTQETAACLSLTEDAVKTRLHRARAMLRENLDRRAGVTLRTLFEFGNANCDRIVAAVMARIAAG